MNGRDTHITLRSGRLRIMIAAASIRQIVPADGILRVPLTRQGVAGVLAREGRAIPVYEITALTRDGTRVEPETERRQIVIVERDGMLAGFVVAGTESGEPGMDDQPGRARTLDGEMLLRSCGIFDAGRSGDHAATAAGGDS